MWQRIDDEGEIHGGKPACGGLMLTDSVQPSVTAPNRAFGAGSSLDQSDECAARAFAMWIFIALLCASPLNCAVREKGFSRLSQGGRTNGSLHCAARRCVVVLPGMRL